MSSHKGTKTIDEGKESLYRYGKHPKILNTPFHTYFTIVFNAVLSENLNGVANLSLHCKHMPFCKKLWSTKF